MPARIVVVEALSKGSDSVTAAAVSVRATPSSDWSASMSNVHRPLQKEERGRPGWIGRHVIRRAAQGDRLEIANAQTVRHTLSISFRRYY